MNVPSGSASTTYSPCGFGQAAAQGVAVALARLGGRRARRPPRRAAAVWSRELLSTTSDLVDGVERAEIGHGGGDAGLFVVGGKDD